jgi:hypothetical protein
MSSFSPVMEIGLAWDTMASTRPAISSTVSPLARSATRKPAIWTGVADPDMMVSMAHAVLSALRWSPFNSAEMRRGQVLPAGADT